jgi:hypothetical protein
VKDCHFIFNADTPAALAGIGRQHHETSHPNTKFRPGSSYLPLVDVTEPSPVMAPQQMAEGRGGGGGIIPTIAQTQQQPVIAAGQPASGVKGNLQRS